MKPLTVLALPLLLSGTIATSQQTISQRSTSPQSTSQQPTSKQSNDLLSERLRGPVHTVGGQSKESISVDGHQSDGSAGPMDSLTFDSRGWLVKRIVYSYGILLGIETYTHDDAGNLTASEFRDETGKILDRQVFIFENGTLKQSTSFDGNGNAGLKQVLTYDGNRIMLEETDYHMDRLIGKTVFKSDERGNLIEAAFFMPNGAKAIAPIGPCYEVHRVVYAYDAKGRVIGEVSYNVDGSEKRKSSYKYDDNGNVSEELRVDHFSTLKFVHTYEYDRYGNWTKEIVEVDTSRLPLFGNEPDQSHRHIVRQRTITYY